MGRTPALCRDRSALRAGVQQAGGEGRLGGFQRALETPKKTGKISRVILPFRPQRACQGVFPPPPRGSGRLVERQSRLLLATPLTLPIDLLALQSLQTGR